MNKTKNFVEVQPLKQTNFPIPEKILCSKKLASIDKVLWSLIFAFDRKFLVSLSYIAKNYTYDSRQSVIKAARRLEEANFLYREGADEWVKTFYLFDNEEDCIAFKKYRESENQKQTNESP